MLGVEFLQEWNAPLTTGSSSEAFRNQARDRRILPRDVVAEFSQTDAETEADVVVGVQGIGLR